MSASEGALKCRTPVKGYAHWQVGLAVRPESQVAGVQFSDGVVYGKSSSVAVQ